MKRTKKTNKLKQQANREAPSGGLYDKRAILLLASCKLPATGTNSKTANARSATVAKGFSHEGVFRLGASLREKSRPNHLGYTENPMLGFRNPGSVAYPGSLPPQELIHLLVGSLETIASGLP